jgi:phosphatidylglycerophosphate synthase
VIKEKLGQHLDGWIQRAFPFLFTRRLDPNWLTVAGTAVSLGAAWAFAEGHLRAGALVMLAGGFFDLVDGVVARRFGISTSFGAFLDSTLDRVVDMALMLGLVIHYGRQDEGLPQLLAAVVLVSSIVTSYAKARAELMIPHLPGGLLERGERVGLLAAGGLFGMMVPALWVLAAGTTLTAGQRMAAAWRGLGDFDRSQAVEGSESGPGQRAGHAAGPAADTEPGETRGDESRGSAGGGAAGAAGEQV